MNEINESEADDIIAVTVAMITDDLNDEQLDALDLCASLDGDPRAYGLDYDTVAPLFTEQGGTRMGPATKEALARVIAERFGGAR